MLQTHARAFGLRPFIRWPFCAVAMLLALAGCSFDRAGLASNDSTVASDRGIDAGDLEPAFDTLHQDTRKDGATSEAATADGNGGLRDFAPREDGALADGHVDQAVADQLGPDQAADLAVPPDLKVIRELVVVPSGCDQLFGKVPGYRLCGETATTCRFYYNLPDGEGAGCDTWCGSASRCISLEDNESGESCQRETNMSCSGSECVCSSPMNDAICTCKRLSVSPVP